MDDSQLSLFGSDWPIAFCSLRQRLEEDDDDRIRGYLAPRGAWKSVYALGFTLELR